MKKGDAGLTISFYGKDGHYLELATQFRLVSGVTSGWVEMGRLFLLTALPASIVDILRLHFSEITLPLGRVLCEPGDRLAHVYFPSSGVVSVVTVMGDGGFWHKQQDPNQMWLDSIYMGEPFLMRYGTVFGTCGTFCTDTVVKQMTLIAAHVRDTTNTGLFYHAWDDSPTGKAAWADPTTGRSSE